MWWWWEGGREEEREGGREEVRLMCPTRRDRPNLATWRTTPPPSISQLCCHQHKTLENPRKNCAVIPDTPRNVPKPPGCVFVQSLVTGAISVPSLPLVPMVCAVFWLFLFVTLCLPIQKEKARVCRRCGTRDKSVVPCSGKGTRACVFVGQ